MRWVGISGSWRTTSKEVEKDVRDFVRDVIQQGDGIVTGGALNVDYFATDEALKFDKEGTHIKVFLPSTLGLYEAHYRKKAEEGVVSPEQVDALINQLSTLRGRNSTSLIENKNNQVIHTENYYARNTEVVNASDVLAAFQVNASKGTQDTIEKARAQGKEVILRQYSVS